VSAPGALPTPTTLGLRTVIQHVSDLSRARDWYAAAFGISPYFDEPFYVGFQIGGFELGLDPDCSRVMPGEGGSAAYWGVSDIRSACDHFTQCGATTREPAREVGGGIWVAMLADPFGNAIGLIQNPQFSTDAVR
jgi:predicted enzyme related to lactoylglutathione lyase